MDDQVFPPVPPTALVMTLLVVLSAVSVDVRLNAVPTVTPMVYGDSAGDPARIQISLSSGASQTTATGSGGTYCVSCIPPIVTVVCVEDTLLHVNAVELMDVVLVKSEAVGMPGEPDGRVSNPAAAGALLDSDRAIVTVMDPPLAAVADKVRNRSRPAVVVAVTYASGIV